MRSLWMDPEAQSFPALETDIDVDFAVVGAGFSGIGACLGLAGTGATVALLESRTVSSGASGRNAGFVLAGPAPIYSDAVTQLGSVSALDVWNLTLENNRRLSDLIAKYDIECGYMRRGSMSLASCQEECDGLQDSHRALLAAGICTSMVTAEQLPAPFDDLYCAGLYYPGNAELDPGAFLREIACHLERVVLFERTPVSNLHWDGRWHLQTPHGRVRAGQVILATNAYTSSLLSNVRIIATRGQVLATEPIGRVVVPFPMYADFGYQYWRQTIAGTLLVGGWRNLDLDGEVGTDEVIHAQIQGALITFVRRVAGDVEVAHQWAGIMGFTPDQLPLVGQLDGASGLWISAGFSGHGVSMALTCGKRVAERAAGLPVQIPECFNPERFGHVPVRDFMAVE